MQMQMQLALAAHCVIIWSHCSRLMSAQQRTFIE
jgi:hypothetical protein